MEALLEIARRVAPFEFLSGSHVLIAAFHGRIITRPSSSEVLQA